jgi:hypothetical protein
MIPDTPRGSDAVTPSVFRSSPDPIFSLQKSGGKENRGKGIFAIIEKKKRAGGQPRFAGLFSRKNRREFLRMTTVRCDSWALPW